MGIVNVTPDSFSDGGAHFDPDAAIAVAVQMAADGADILDIGGESTRPGAAQVSAEEEWRRVEPVLAGLRNRVSVPLSIDTTKAEVAARALDAGVAIVNDISGLTYDAAMGAAVAQRGAALVVMHTRGRHQRMYEHAQYGDVVSEVIDELRERGRAAAARGVEMTRVIYDPGFGFAKRAEHSMAVLAGFERLHELGRPLLSGPSRKSFLEMARPGSAPAERVWATAAAVTASILAGAHIVRVHDVAQMVQVARTADAIAEGRCVEPLAGEPPPGGADRR
jgi:dihydropteroate synthase